MNIEDTIRSYIAESFLDEQQALSLRNDEDLLTILDSLQLLRMLMDLESRYGIAVDNGELSAENVGSVERLAAFIARKQQSAMC